MRYACTRTSKDWNILPPSFLETKLPQNLDKKINSFLISTKQFLPKNSSQIIPPKKILPKFFPKKSKFLYGTWRPKTLSGLFFLYLDFLKFLYMFSFNRWYNWWRTEGNNCRIIWFNRISTCRRFGHPLSRCNSRRKYCWSST